MKLDRKVAGVQVLISASSAAKLLTNWPPILRRRQRPPPHPEGVHVFSFAARLKCLVSLLRSLLLPQKDNRLFLFFHLKLSILRVSRLLKRATGSCYCSLLAKRKRQLTGELANRRKSSLIRRLLIFHLTRQSCVTCTKSYLR